MLKTAKVVGLNSDQEVALALVNKPLSIPATEQSRVEPGLYLLVLASLDDAFTRTRLALSEAEDVFYSSELGISERINETVQTIKKSLVDSENTQILVAATESDSAGKNVLYLMVVGDRMNADLYRGEDLIRLNDVGSGEQLISGFLEQGDRVTLSTASFKEVLGDELRSLKNMPVDIWESSITDFLPPGTVNPLAAIIIEEEVPTQEPELPIVGISGQDLRKQSSLGNIFFRPAVPKLNLSIKPLLRSGKLYRYLIAIAIVLIGVGGYYLYTHKFPNQQSSKFNDYLNQANLEYQQALNQKDSDQRGAIKNLSLAKQSVAGALKIKPQDSAATNLQKQIDGSSAEILKIWQISDLPVWLDLSLVKQDMQAVNMSLSLGDLLILDQKEGTLASINLDSKSHQILAGSDKLGQAKLVTINGQNGFVYSQNKGVIRVDLQSGDLSTVIAPDTDWGQIADIYGFGGNIYLLDKNKNQIWKYIAITDGYSDKRNYLNEGVSADFSQSIRMQIDASIWVLNSSGTILKFTQGNQDQFTLNGLDKPLSNPQSFFVSDKTNNVYILDNGNNRIVVVDKNGNYVAQYQSDRLGVFTDLVVDEENKKIYLLSGSKIYQIELKT
ncbi:hypothetical protein M1563_01050 [Patescibacteria group bacterium]|nr:hypothetical protein [Patescibacteria group bacterium]MCL5410174.1 hypothetical protein [Patescibacteria group bacterium]